MKETIESYYVVRIGILYAKDNRFVTQSVRDAKLFNLVENAREFAKNVIGANVRVAHICLTATDIA